MALQTTKKISLDFYNNNIITINAKQLDSESRYLDITCTDHGKKIVIDSGEVSAYVRFKKPDGFYVFNEATITDDGTVLIELTNQMLAVSGKGIADILLVDIETTVENLSDLTSIYELESSVLSTMTFYVNILATAVNHSDIESADEFDAVTQWVIRMGLVEDHMEDLDDTLNTNELTRQSNEETRESNEKLRIEAEEARVEAETQRVNAENARVNAETKRVNAEAARVSAESSRVQAESDREEAETSRNEAVDKAIFDCNTAATDANEAAQLCQEVIDGSGVVLKSQVVNNLTTTDSGYVLDARQGYTLNELIISLQNTINSLPQILNGSDAPTDSIGKDGDIYMQIIEAGE